MKKLIFWGLISLYSFLASAQIESELPLNDSLYNNIEESNPLMFGDSPNGAKRTTHSLRRFCPPTYANVPPVGGLQWSFAVTLAMNIQYSEMNGEVMSYQKQFSPQFLYDLLPKSSSVNCRLESTWAQDTKEILETIGTVSLSDYPIQTANCDRKPEQKQLEKARRYCVRSFNKLFKTGTGNEDISIGGKISAITGCLDRNHPVILCLKADKQFSLLKSPIWEPTFSSGTSTFTVIIIGYNKATQLFEVAGLNGSQWGNQGFAGIRFKDLIYAFYGFEIVMNPSATPSGKPVQPVVTNRVKVKPHNHAVRPAIVPEEATLSGELLLKEVVDYDRYRAAAMSYHKAGYFEPIKSYGLKSQFQLISHKTQKGSYVYVFSIDPKGKAEVHYPYFRATGGFGLSVKPVSPAIPSEESEIVIPKPRVEIDSEGNSRRIEQALIKEESGTDWLVVLYSDKRLENELDELIQKLAVDNRNFVQRFREVFGARLIPEKEVKLEETKFKARSNQGYIVPLIIRLTAY